MQQYKIVYNAKESRHQMFAAYDDGSIQEVPMSRDQTTNLQHTMAKNDTANVATAWQAKPYNSQLKMEAKDKDTLMKTYNLPPKG